MKKKFIICLDSSTIKQDEQFQEFINKNDFNWWHWISNTWLLIDYKGELETTMIRDKLMEIYPNVYHMVFEVPNQFSNWSGFGAKGKTREDNMFMWMDENWDKY